MAFALSSFGGVWPAMLTPLHDDLSPNEAMIDKLVNTFVDLKLDGIYLLGSTGHGQALPAATRQAVAARAIKAAAGRLPVMVHVGSYSTAESVEMARHAADCGADAISSVPPIYFPCNADMVFEHYRRIGSATDLPFLIYHIQLASTGFTNAVDYAQRINAVPNIGGMKFTDHDLYTLSIIRQHVAERLRIFSGPDQLCCHAALSGACGAIGSFYNMFGPAVQKARAAFVNGDVNAGMRFMPVFARVLYEITSTGNTYAYFRQAMRMRYDVEIGPGAAPNAVLGKPWDEAFIRRTFDEVDTAAGV